MERLNLGSTPKASCGSAGRFAKALCGVKRLYAA
jgi:hypothetical protein